MTNETEVTVRVTEAALEAHERLVDAAWAVILGSWEAPSFQDLSELKAALRANTPGATEPDPDEARDRMYDL